MRWFKHLVGSWDDEKIAGAVSDHGLELYGFWWRILEIIAKQMDSSPKTYCQYSVKTWAKFAGISPKKFQKFAGILIEKKLIFTENILGEIKIDIPNLVKFRDEWTSRNIKNT